MPIVANHQPTDHTESSPAPVDHASQVPPAAVIDAADCSDDRRADGRPRLDAAQIKASLGDVAAVIAALRLTEGAKPQTGGLVIRCPFHDDRNASCSVVSYPNGIGVKCHACGAKGDVLALIAKVNGLDPRADFARVLQLGAELVEMVGPCVAANPVVTVRPEIHDAAKRLLEQYPLASNPRAVRYLEQRGLIEEASAARWGALPDDPAALASLIAELGGQAVALGIANAKGKAKLAGHVLLIPWYSRDGRIDTVQRRMLEPKGDPKYAMPAGLGAREPYGVDRLGGAAHPLAIVEGALDTLAYRKLCLEAGIERDVVGVPGVTTWKGEWDSLVIGRDVIVAFDDDAAGNDGAAKISKRLAKAGATSIARRTPKGAKDWAQLVEVTPVSEVGP